MRTNRSASASAGQEDDYLPAWGTHGGGPDGEAALGVGYLPDSQFIDNVQWHCLLPIDLTFNPAVPNQFCQCTDAELFRFTEVVKSVGGAITINVPIEVETGHIPQDRLAQLVRLGKHLKTKGQH